MVPQQHRRRRRRAAQVRTAERRLIVARGPGGFGFTIAGQRPCVVSDVALGGPAERAGLRPGDALLAVDGANVSRASHTAVARLVAAAPQSISLSVALRESQPTDTEDTEPDERSRTRRRHPPPRRRLQQPPILHYPGCYSIPTTSGVNELLQNIHRSQMNPAHAARLECRAVIGYLGTIETPQTSESAASSVKTAVRKLRQEKRPATPVLLSVLPNVMFLRRPNGQTLAQYPRERIIHAGCSSDADRRYFGLVTSANPSTEATGHSCHVFAVDPRMGEHDAHVNRAREFQIPCTRDPVAERCLEFPPSAEYVVGIVKGMYSLPSEDCTSPALQQISKLAIKGDSPSVNDFCRPNRVALRVPRIGRRPNCRNDNRIEGQELPNSPQPSNHSEITTTSSNSDSGIGFHNDGRNIAERILVVDFGVQQPFNRRVDQPRRPLGMVGCNNFDDGSFLSNTTPVVDAFGGQGRPLNALDDVMLNPNDLNIPYPNRNDETCHQDSYNYNYYSNMPSTSQNPPNGYDTVFTENEYQYEFIPPQFAMESDLDRVAESLNSVEFYEESRVGDSISNEGDSVEADTVVSGLSKASADTISMYSSRSHEEARPSRVRHMQASLDDMLVIGRREEKQAKKDDDDDNFLHPGSIKCKVRKSKPRSLLARTKNMLTSRKDSKTVARERAMSASDVARAEAENADSDAVLAACSEPDLRDSQTEQSSPFRRWTTGSGAGSSYRHDHRSMYNKQMSDLGPSSVSNKCPTGTNGSGGGSVARWSLGLEQLLADPAGASAFAHFLTNEFANENIRFWWSCEQYNQCTDANARQAQAQEIWQRHLVDGAPEPVNIDAAAKRATALRLQYCPEDLFQQAQKQIFNVMKFDSYPRFLRSSVHAECARADLRGLPLPYAPRRDSDNTPSKLKKSASNASERRRSGGTSLLPWRLRAQNKEQSASTQSINGQNHCDNEPQKPQQTTTNQPQSPPPPTNGYTLCRVVLPDGATSVVGVEESVPVRVLLERLLRRRHVPTHSFDVLYRDQQQQKGGVPVDLSAPSTVLGGRCVVVERRCVVRVEIGGRCVAVRCRPSRPLRHALTPLLQRYNISPNVATRVMLNGSAVDPDTSMQELDGLRLQVVLATDAETSASATRLSSLRQKRDSDPTLRDCDAESIGDLALRLNEDGDSQSCKSLCRSENSSQSSTSCGLVRAALKPGPPLHHHPTDFLDNLRETQQRLRLQQGRPEPLSAAELRSPPPLPPKPRTIQAPAIV